MAGGKVVYLPIDIAGDDRSDNANSKPGALCMTVRTEGLDIWVDMSGEIDLSTSNKMERAIT